MLSLAAALMLGGCSSAQAPKLSVIEARVTEVTQDGVRLEFLIDAENPNEEPLPLREARYSLSLDGDTVFNGFRAPQATLRRLGTQRIMLPAVIRAEDIEGISPTPSYRLSGTLGYVTPGEIADLLFDYRVRRPQAPFDDRGTLDLSELLDEIIAGTQDAPEPSNDSSDPSP